MEINTQKPFDFSELDQKLAGNCHWDDLHLMMYATDASVYRNRPRAVVYPKTDEDVATVLAWCAQRQISITPRAAGTSLAGQCVSDGVVLDVSRYLNQIIHFDAQQKTITVQPGVVRDDLNRYLKPHGLFFGPNTSTSSRSTLGGMVGNNSSGTTSIKYGVTRDKVLALSGYLGTGEFVTFCRPGFHSNRQIEVQKKGQHLKTSVIDLLSEVTTRQNIIQQYPKPSIHRRNTGYALDLLAAQWENHETQPADLDLLPLICGSEGTLMISTAITLHLDELPPEHNALVVLQYSSMEECMLDVVTAMKHDLYTCELIDDVVLDCTDNFTSRFALNRACYQAKVPLVSGAAIRWEGQLSTYDFRKSDSPCYQCLYTEESGQELTCSQNGVLSPVVGMIGSMQAIEAVKALLNLPTFTGKLMIIDAYTMMIRTLNLKKDVKCQHCSDT